MLWLACHDTDAANAELACKLTTEARIGFPLDYIPPWQMHFLMTAQI